MSFPQLQPFEPPRPEKERRPTVQVHAGLAELPPTEWASLLGDLARPSVVGAKAGQPVEFRVHDRTHLEFAIDYPFGERPRAFTWEAFFFVPESFRLDETTYDKKQIYDDLLSYVRLAVPELPFERLGDREGAEALLVQVERAVREASGAVDGSDASARAMRASRVFACMVRASGLEAQRAMLHALDLRGPPGDEAARAVARFTGTSSRVSQAFREVRAAVSSLSLPDELRVALEWVDEDISLVLEALAATASVHVQTVAQRDASWADLASRLAAQAVLEARYRQERGWQSVGRADASARDVEHLEFRRHVLKRFTSSVLWLSHEVRDASVWVVHLLYGLAAALAMGFAVVVSIRAMQLQQLLLPYVTLLVVSYAIKDRMKAVLQQQFSRWADRRFPDRRWLIRDRERREDVGNVVERAAFRPFLSLPRDVLEARRMTRLHPLEEAARPERVLWHEKQVVIGPRHEGLLRSPMLTEIFRLNIAQWLQHTDDPNRKITFADPGDAAVYAATARRVYNLNVVYRLREGDEPAGPYRRIRVVVSRKGIERIDEIR